ncbi:hypothetical protein IAI58_22880 (plasmid) [Roseomonas marmotae]|uniref:hypothetical protein n=1 Tax=Roseomonas marmotae TaxID=2768161 RepID=UPI001AD71111|nr:hypothetical protein [Roseomonas marmotae]QTI82194.1 hypothetical protein IAI58_22880 [Roseomonas marmotae]
MLRKIIGPLALLLWLSGTTVAQQSTKSPDFPHVIVNNDLTGLDTVVLGAKRLTGPRDQALVEIANAFRTYVRMGDDTGADAQSLAVNISTFQFWANSKLYSLSDHDRFLHSLRYYSASPAGNATNPSNIRMYLSAGHDFIADFLNNNGSSRQVKILSFRLNDHHYTWNWELFNSRSRQQVLQAPHDDKPFCDRSGHSEADVENNQQWTEMSFTRYFQAFRTGVLEEALGSRCVQGMCLAPSDFNVCAHGRTCTLGQSRNAGRCGGITLDLAQPLVQRFKIMQMAEVVAEYRPAFFEIDLNRFPRHFPTDMPLAKRIVAMSSFLGEASATLRRINPAIRIGLRVPSKQRHREEIGVDLPALDRSQVSDYVILAMPAIADQQIQYQLDSAKAHTRVYAEMFQSIGAISPDQANFDSFRELAAAGYSLNQRFYPATSRSLTTAAHLAYALHEVQGIALFNSQYYAATFQDGNRRKPLQQPSQAMRRLSDPNEVSKLDQHYFLTSTHYGLSQSCSAPPASDDVCDQLPFTSRQLQAGHTFSMELAPPVQGWDMDRGILRMTVLAYPGSGKPLSSSDYAQIRSSLSVTINGKLLNEAPDNTVWPLDPEDGEQNNRYYRSMWWTAPAFNSIFKINPSSLKIGKNNLIINYNPTPHGVNRAFRVVNFEMSLPARQLR